MLSNDCNEKEMDKELIILGAGASVDFVSKHVNRDIAYGTTEQIKETPLPISVNFFQRAIQEDLLKENSYPVLQRFIEQEFNITFNDLKNGQPLDVEEVYLVLDEKIKNTESE